MKIVFTLALLFPVVSMADLESCFHKPGLQGGSTTIPDFVVCSEGNGNWVGGYLAENQNVKNIRRYVVSKENLVETKVVNEPGAIGTISDELKRTSSAMSLYKYNTHSNSTVFDLPPDAKLFSDHTLKNEGKITDDFGSFYGSLSGRCRTRNFSMIHVKDANPAINICLMEVDCTIGFGFDSVSEFTDQASCKANGPNSCPSANDCILSKNISFNENDISVSRSNGGWTGDKENLQEIHSRKGSVR